jgi:uncharacterized protein YfiM (DUF2279 family)
VKLALVLAFSLSAPSGDRWFARDKAKHFVAAALIQSVSYAAFREVGARRTSALWQATAVTAAASLGKEAFDRHQGRLFSVRDLAWDAGGAGMASLAIIRVSRK